MKQLKRSVIGKPEQWLIEAAASIGLDYSGLSHEITDSFVAHCQKQHGDTVTEKARGQLPVAPSDIEHISDIVKNPDSAIIGIKKYGQIFNAYLKDGIIYFEEVLNGKRTKSLRSKTMFKKTGKVNYETFFKIVSNNIRSDVSGAKMVVGAGGQSGSEAE